MEHQHCEAPPETFSISVHVHWTGRIIGHFPINVHKYHQQIQFSVVRSFWTAMNSIVTNHFPENIRPINNHIVYLPRTLLDADATHCSSFMPSLRVHHFWGCPWDYGSDLTYSPVKNLEWAMLNEAFEKSTGGLVLNQDLKMVIVDGSHHHQAIPISSNRDGLQWTQDGSFVPVLPLQSRNCTKGGNQDKLGCRSDCRDFAAQYSIHQPTERHD